MKKWKKGLALTLAVNLSLALCACGGNTDSGTNSGDSGTSSATNSADSKEGVFDLQEYDIESLIDDNISDYYVGSPTVVDDRLWFFLEGYDYSGDTTQTVYYIVSMNTDGTDMQKIEPEFWQDGVNPYKTGEETAAAEETDATTEDDGSYTWESQNIGNLTITPDGRILGIKSYYCDSTDAEGNYSYINASYVTEWNEDGTIAWDTEIAGLQTDESYSYISGMATNAEGSPVLIIGGDQCGILEVAEDGSLGEIRTSDTISTFIDNYSYIRNNQDGTISVLYYDTDDWTTQYVATYDLSADTLSEPMTVPSTVAYNMQGNFSITEDGTLWYETSTGISCYKNGAEDGEQVMNFINSDLYTNYFDSMVVLDDQHIIAFYYKDTDDGSGVTTGGLFTYVAPEDIPDKVTVTIGTNGTYYEMRQRVVEFNKQSDTTRIAIKDYSEYNSYDDYEAWKTQLNNDILSGNMPDILDVSDLEDSMNSYVSKGLLASVDDLIANDPELADTEFLDNALEARRINGTLYEVFPYFNVNTFIAKSSLVGDKTSLTMDEALEIVASMGEDARLISGQTRDYFFSTAMNYVGREYVDVAAGTCNFESEGFLSLMEYAKTLPTEDEVYSEDYDGDVYEDFYGDDSQYRENKTLLCSLYISSISDINYYLNGIFGEDISYVGFPNDGGCRGVIYTSKSFALSAKSEVLDEAWDFISYYLKEEYQNDISYGLPVTRAAFNALAQAALEKPYYTDADGNKVEYDETYWINDEEITLPTMTQEQVDAAVEFIESLTTTYYYDEDVINIINEEVEAYYSDQKSAEDVAAIIQSRVKIFVQENS